MSALPGIVALLCHMALMLAAAPLLDSVAALVRARLLGQAAPSVRQPYREMARLLRKQPVVPEGASALFRAAPVAAFGALAAAAALVPSFSLGMATAGAGDLVVVLGLLAAARAVMLLAALDTGTASGGAWAGREAMVAVIGAPALLLVVVTLALLAGSTQLDAIAGAMRDGLSGRLVPVGLAALAWAVLAVARQGRPGGERAGGAGLDEYGGWPRAVALWGGALRRLVWVTLAGDVVAPWGMADAATPATWPIGLLAWAARTVLFVVVVAVADVFSIDQGPARRGGSVAVALLLALLAALMMFAGQGGA